MKRRCAALRLRVGKTPIRPEHLRWLRFRHPIRLSRELPPHSPLNRALLPSSIPTIL